MQALAPPFWRARWRIGLAAAVLIGMALLGGRMSGAGSVSAGETSASELHLISAADESLRVTLRRAGLGVDDANSAAFTLTDALDPERPPPGLSLDLKVEHAIDDPRLRLIEMVVRRQGRITATLTRAADGSLRLNKGAEAIPPPPLEDAHEAPAVLQGPMEEVLYGETPIAGDTLFIVQAARLFARKLDLTRDIALGDTVRLVFTRRVASDGRVLGPGRLLYAEVDTRVGATRYYAHRRVSTGDCEFVDQDGGEFGGMLLRTPLDNPRITSDFGMRMHPLLGYTRMHQGLDFGAPVGAAVVAASDGVVEEVRWAGGYGRWIKLRHSASLETGYGHLSGWAAGLRDGDRIRQGQVIGYVGSTGLSTGPHLHYEVLQAGRPVDPKTVQISGETTLKAGERAAFELEKQRVAFVLRSAPSIKSPSGGPSLGGGD